MTAYDSDAKCTSRSSPELGGHGLTASGILPMEGVTVGCARSWMGRWVDVPGFGLRLCEDTGSKVKEGHVDVYVSTHREARKIGITRYGGESWSKPKSS